jgi:Family of unknown function (DUF6527)
VKQSSFVPEFVETIPEDLEEGRLFISVYFRTAAHLCACGCGSRVVTPIKPAKWSFTYNGETVSLYPSIGRWQHPCRSHYWIRRNRVEWSRPFDDEQIEEVLQKDAADLRSYYEGRASGLLEGGPAVPWWKRFLRHLI